MNKPNDRGPAVFFPPPLIFITAIGLSYLLDPIIPLFKLTSYFWLLIGSTGAVLCIGIFVYGLWSFFKAKTHIEPWQPASQLITNGLYRYSRNPLYFAMFIFTLCFGLILVNTWIIVLSFVALWLIQTFVVSKEEAYLEATFADKYITYKRRVNRWF